MFTLITFCFCTLEAKTNRFLWSQGSAKQAKDFRRFSSNSRRIQLLRINHRKRCSVLPATVISGSLAGLSSESEIFGAFRINPVADSCRDFGRKRKVWVFFGRSRHLIRQLYSIYALTCRLLTHSESVTYIYRYISVRCIKHSLLGDPKQTKLFHNPLKRKRGFGSAKPKQHLPQLTFLYFKPVIITSFDMLQLQFRF